MPDGTTCYSGPTCKKHGFLTELKTIIQNIDDSVNKKSNYVPQNITDAKPSNRSRIKGDNHLEEKNDIHKQLDEEAKYRDEVLSYEQNQNLRHYVSSYGYINKFLTHKKEGIIDYLNTTFSSGSYGKDKTQIDRYMVMAQDRVDALDDVFKTYKRPERNVRALYRKVSVNGKHKHIVGETFVWKGFMSTSVDPDAVLAFEPENNKQNHIVYEIFTKEGVPVHKHDSHASSAGHAEREVLLNRGSRFTVKNIREVKFVSSYPNGKPTNHSMYRNAQKSATYTVVQLIEA